MIPSSIKSIGVHIFAGAHQLSHGLNFADLVSEGFAAVHPQVFSHYFTVSGAGKAGGPRALKDVVRVMQNWQSSRDEMTVLITQHGRLIIPHDQPYAEFVFSRTRPGSRISAHEFLDQLSLGCTDNFIVETETSLVKYITSLFERCAGRYAIVHSASCDLLLRSEVGILRGNPAGYLPEEYIFDRSMRLTVHRERFGEMIAGANWGVMIDRALVDQMGGLARVQREAPVYRVTELAAGAVFMQATARPMPLTDLELQRVLPEFEAYLEPISAPIGPYFRTRYAK